MTAPSWFATHVETIFGAKLGPRRTLVTDGLLPCPGCYAEALSGPCDLCHGQRGVAPEMLAIPLGILWVDAAGPFDLDGSPEAEARFLAEEGYAVDEDGSVWRLEVDREAAERLDALRQPTALELWAAAHARKLLPERVADRSGR